jgi:lysozyme
MKTGKLGKAIIQKWEGYHTALPDGGCEAYLDRVAVPPVWTIGCGLTDGVHKGMKLTRKQHDDMFSKELEQTENEVAKVLKVELNQNQYDALISIAYNLKGGIAKAPTLMKHINNQDWDKASQAFLLYCKAGSKTVKGLLNRRMEEKKLFDTWTKEEISEVSTTVSMFRRWRNALGGLTVFSLLADSFVVVKEYVDWLAQYSPSPKYLIAAGVVGAAFGIHGYVENKKVQEHEEGRYTPAE